MSFIFEINQDLFLAINGLAGKVAPLDKLMRFLVNDYVVPASLSLLLLGLWFEARTPAQRRQNQIAVIVAASGTGIATGLVKVFNMFLKDGRPFQDIPSVMNTVNKFFYPPSDPSFPSNSATVAFAMATGVLLGNRNAGLLCYGVAALYGLSRVYSGVHYPLDILGGAALGIVTTYLFYRAFLLTEPLFSPIFRVLRSLHLA